MNDKFTELPEEKRQRIINAGLQVFSENEYKKASTERIAELAGISKGLLFYYFHNKKELYLYLFDYVCDLIKKSVLDEGFSEITDFFELCHYSAKKKFELIASYPQIFDFTIRAFYLKDKEISEEVYVRIAESADTISMEKYFVKADYSKFKEDIEPMEIVQMLAWLADGFMHERQRQGSPINFNEIMEKYRYWAEMFKKVSYREEYL